MNPLLLMALMGRGGISRMLPFLLLGGGANLTSLLGTAAGKIDPLMLMLMGGGGGGFTKYLMFQQFGPMGLLLADETKPKPKRRRRNSGIRLISTGRARVVSARSI